MVYTLIRMSIWDQPKGKKSESLYFASSLTGASKKSKTKSLGLGLLNEPKSSKERDSRRTFSARQKSEILYQQNNKCASCHKQLDPRAIDYDHIKSWADNGKTIKANGAALCPTCHRLKTHQTGLKETDKKRKPKEPSFGIGSFGSSKSSGLKNPFKL